jgi:hypothetical protein
VTNSIPPQSDTAGFEAGSRISGYRLEQQVGRGGMAVVFRAHDERLNRPVALKILSPVLAHDDAFRQRFIAESRAAAAVEDPNIIPVYEAGEADGVLFIAMRLVRGGDLRTLVTQQGPLAPGRAEWIVSAVASALDAAHASGLVHRDVKPANMLLDVRPGRPDHVYLSDFGVSKAALASSGLTGSGQFLGTVDYAAPEQIHGQVVDGKADQYALGCSAFELLCGHPPFFGKEWLAAMYSHLSTPPPCPSTVRAELPAAVDAVFAKVLSKSPDDRYRTCQDFGAALRAALGGQPYAPDGLTDPGRHLAPDAEDNATLNPAAVERLAFRIGRGARPDDLRGGDDDDAALQAALTGDTEQRQTRQATVSKPWGRAGARSGPLPSGSQPGRSRTVLLGVLIPAILLAGTAAGLLLARSLGPPPAARHQFAQQQFPDGLAVSQLWRLTGPGGSELDVTITVSNANSTAVTAQLEEPIPVAVARDPRALRFPVGPRPLVTGRLLVWGLRLRAGDAAVVSYRVHEPPLGVSQSRLQLWVQAFRRVASRQTLIASPAFRSVWISPLNLQLAVGGTGTLRVHGRLDNGRLAPRADLAGAVWASANPAVLRVSPSGVVTAESAGTTLVTVQIGAKGAVATVVVYSPGGVLPAPASSSPATAPSLSASPTPSGSPSPSSSPSPSPSSSPSPSPSSPSPSVTPGQGSAGVSVP